MQKRFETVLEESALSQGREYRIPAVVLTRRGTLLAAYEVRSGGGDWSETRLALRRSTDGGKSFGEAAFFEPEAGSTLHNPTFIADGDRVHLLFCRDYQRAFHAVSLDDGATFSQPVEITKSFAPLAEGFPFNVLAIGPGHGIRLSDGALLAPVWIANGRAAGRIREHRPSAVSVLLSGDGGKSWRCGGLVPVTEGFLNPSETGALELSDGRVLLNLRNESPCRRRGFSFSPDRGRHFSAPVFAPDLVDPVCFGSMAAAGEVLYYAGCRDERERINLTLLSSADGGERWLEEVLIAQKAGYADLAAAPGRVYCLYEEGGEKGVERIILAVCE